MAKKLRVSEITEVDEATGARTPFEDMGKIPGQGDTRLFVRGRTGPPQKKPTPKMPDWGEVNAQRPQAAILGLKKGKPNG